MNICVCNRSSLYTADGVENTCGFPHDMSPTATANALLTKSGCLFEMLNDAVSKPTDTQRRMTMDVLTDDMWYEPVITSCRYDGILL
jgi:hypothetical protein